MAEKKDKKSSGLAVRNGASEHLPGLSRIAATTAARSAMWTLGSGVRQGRLLARAMTNPSAASELVHSLANDVAEASKAVSDVARAVSSGVPLPKALLEGSISLTAVVLPEPPEAKAIPKSEKSLRERGEELLQRSRDVWNTESGHPAYERILDELAPDEARILVLLARGGPQPSVDIRAGGPMSSSMVAPGLNMIGPRAGLRYLENVPAYLNNLFRLGLIWFSREQLDDPLEYQVVEAQPDVLAAMHSVRFAKVVRRSIHLTPFGTDFCTTCLVDPEESKDLPAHEVPVE